MGVLFDFNRLLKKYGAECQLIRETGGGMYVGGNWVPGPAREPEMVSGAVVPMTDRKIYQSGGTYTEQDRELITMTEIPLEPAAYILHRGKRYHVESENDYSGYAGFHDYNMKRVSAIDRSEQDKSYHDRRAEGGNRL